MPTHPRCQACSQPQWICLLSHKLRIEFMLFCSSEMSNCGYGLQNQCMQRNNGIRRFQPTETDSVAPGAGIHILYPISDQVVSAKSKIQSIVLTGIQITREHARSQSRYWVISIYHKGQIPGLSIRCWSYTGIVKKSTSQACVMDL